MFKYALPLSAALLLSACFPDNRAEDSAQVTISGLLDANKAIVVSASSPDWRSSDILLLTPNAEGSLSLREGELATSNPSDIALSTAGDTAFRLNRTNSDSVTAYQYTAAGQLSFAWEYSVLGEDASANPYRMVLDNQGRGFVTRYNANDLWVVNPQAKNQAEFFTQAIDLAAYAIDEDNLPRMSDAVIVGNSLYVLMERLHVSGWTYEPRVESQLAVIDLDTLKVEKAIDLKVRNAAKLQVLGNKIYVVGRGNTSAVGVVGKCKGGISVLDTETQSVDLLFSDCDAEDKHRFGRLTSLAVASPTQAYFIGSTAWGNDALYFFNPSADDVLASVIEVADTSGRGLSSLLVVNNQPNLSTQQLVIAGRFASKEDSAELLLIDTIAPTLVRERIRTGFNPSGLGLVQR